MNLWEFIEKHNLTLKIERNRYSDNSDTKWFAYLSENPFINFGVGVSPQMAIQNLNVKISGIFKDIDEGIVCL